MNFMNRKMFAVGGEAGTNPYFYVNSQGQTQYLDESKLLPILRNTDIAALEALIQNPDVTYSPAAQEVFRQVVGERKATYSSTDPSLFKFGEFLPDNLTGISALRDIGGFAGDFAAQVGEGAYNLGRSVASGFGERSFDDEQFAPQDLFPSQRFPNVANTITGRPGADEGFASGFDKSGILRRGYTNPQLGSILQRALGEVQDFTQDIEAIDEPVVEAVETKDVLDQPTVIEELPTLEPITGGETLGVMSPLESTQRRLAYEKSMIGRDEFGNPLPEGRLLQDPTIAKALEELTPIESLVDIDKTEADSLLQTQDKFDGKFDIPKIELDKVDTTVREEELNTAKAPVIPKETTGLFGSDRFLDFIRNVGGELARTGQIGEGLALGAAKAGEERAARDLMEEQENKKYERDLALAVAVEKAKSAGNTALTPPQLGALQDDVTKLSQNVKDYEGTEASIQIMNSAIDLFDAAIKNDVGITGLEGYVARGIDQIQAFFGATDENVSDSTKIANYIDQVKQRSIREILNESGRTISNLDRDIVDRVFGEINLTDKPSEIRKKLDNARSNLIRNNEDKARTIDMTYTIIQNPAYGGVGTQSISPYVQSILRIINANPAVNTSNNVFNNKMNSSIIDINL